MDNESLIRYLKVIKRAVSLIEDMIQNDDGGLMEQIMDEPNHSHQTQQLQHIDNAPQPAVSNLKEPEKPLVNQALNSQEYDEWKLARNKHIRDLMGIDCWPEAVPDELLAGPSDADQIKRADAVLDMMVDRDFAGLNFLDFGCGEGWIAKQALERGAAESAGYDIKKNEKWSEINGPQFTHIYNELKRNHYDVIFLYDVLDHCQNPEETMKQVRNLLKNNGSVYVRVHPWTSKHASHVYKQGLNKAYIHLFLNWEELHDQTGEEPMFTRKELKPLEAYHWWFDKFDIKKERVIESPVSDFFFVPAFKDLLAIEQNIYEAGVDIDHLLELMKIDFIDYVLVPKP